MSNIKTFQNVKIICEDNEESSQNTNATKSIEVDLPSTYNDFLDQLLSIENLTFDKSNGIFYGIHKGENQLVSEENYNLLREKALSSSSDGAYFFTLLKEKLSAKKDAKESKLFFYLFKEAKESIEYLEKNAIPIINTLISALANKKPSDEVK